MDMVQRLWKLPVSYTHLDVYKRQGLTYVDTETTAYSEVNSLMQEYVIYAHNGEMSVEDALAELKTEADQVIAEAE